MPNKGAHLNVTQVDITMMASLVSLKRTEQQWYNLIEKAGLKIQHIYTYSVALDTILKCVPASQ